MRLTDDVENHLPILTALAALASRLPHGFCFDSSVNRRL
jgi:hypothetical protein